MIFCSTCLPLNLSSNDPFCLTLEAEAYDASTLRLTKNISLNHYWKERMTNVLQISSNSAQKSDAFIHCFQASLMKILLHGQYFDNMLRSHICVCSSILLILTLLWRTRVFSPAHSVTPEEHKPEDRHGKTQRIHFAQKRQSWFGLKGDRPIKTS